MTPEQLLIKHWHNLSVEKQQIVLKFVAFLNQRQSAAPTAPSPQAKPELGVRLRQLRQQIVDAETPLLNETDLATEIASRRGGIAH